MSSSTPDYHHLQPLPVPPNIRDSPIKNAGLVLDLFTFVFFFGIS